MPRYIISGFSVQMLEPLVCWISYECLRQLFYSWIFINIFSILWLCVMLLGIVWMRVEFFIMFTICGFFLILCILGNSDCNQRPVPETNANDNDSNKAQLLEALRHSQTRAREAEIAAKKACAEKEHVVELIFRQASQLFAYKQWFHLLQLENLYFQIKNNRNQSISTIFPVTLPWLPQKTLKQRKSWHKFARGKREKQGRPKYDFGKYALMFALGLSLVGVGVLLGWTIGWMFPSF